MNRMKMYLRGSFVGGICLLVAGCAGTLPASYTPQSFMDVGTGVVEIGKFSYGPAMSGDVDSNQLQNTAAGSIYISTDVSSFVRRATALELERAGLQVMERSPYLIEGKVQEFKIDDLGYSVDWTYKIRYVLKSKDAGKNIIDKVYNVGPVRTGKFGKPSDYTPSINQLVLRAIEKFMEDLKGTGLFAPAEQEAAT